MSGSYWRGRSIIWDPDHQAIEQERQRWVYEKVAGLNQLQQELACDPDKEYAAHRAEYIRTGDESQLRLALEYVRADAV